MIKQVRRIISGVMLTLLCGSFAMTAIGCGQKDRDSEKKTEESVIVIRETEAPSAEAATDPEEAGIAAEPAERPEPAVETPSPDSAEGNGTPNPDRFQFGTTTEEIAEYYANDPDYQFDSHQQELYGILTMHKEFDVDWYKQVDSVRVVPVWPYDDDEWKIEARSRVPGQSLYLPAPEYAYIEFYNLPEVKTNYIVYVSEDGHAEIVCMYYGDKGDIRFAYVDNDPEVYELLKSIAVVITEDDIHV